MAREDDVLRFNNAFIDVEEVGDALITQFYEAETNAEREVIFEELMQRYPNNLDIMLLYLDFDDVDEEKEINTILQFGREQLHAWELDGEDSIGMYWEIEETRPYMRAKLRYLDILREAGKYTLALQQGLALLQLHSEDALGARYRVMAIYAILERYDEAKELYVAWQDTSALMQVPMILLCVRLNRTKEAMVYYDELQERNAHCSEVFGEDGMDTTLMSELILKQSYVEGSLEELYFAWFENRELFVTNQDLFEEFLFEGLKENKRNFFQA